MREEERYFVIELCGKMRIFIERICLILTMRDSFIFWRFS